MQKEVLDTRQRMEVMRTVKDTSSKAGIKTALMIKKVSNDTQIIEENYDCTGSSTRQWASAPCCQLFGSSS